MKSNKALIKWFNNLSCSDRLLVQKFLIRLYIMGDKKYAYKK